MRVASIILALASCLVGLCAAYYWHKATRVSIDPGWITEPGEFEESQIGWTAALIKAAVDSAELNKKAAGLTAIAVVLGVLSSIIDGFAHH